MWDPQTYLRFGDERSRPFFDLLARVRAAAPRSVVDLGCGPGNLTALLGERWPGAAVHGIDSSAEMIERAGMVGTRATFSFGDMSDWKPAPDTDVLITNAALQWVPGHPELLRRWAAELPPGAWLAMQVPGNFTGPSHRALRDAILAGTWSDRLAWLVRAMPVLDPPGYADLFGVDWEVDAWETTYLHRLAESAEHPVLTWMEGTALRPVRKVLPDEDWAAFRSAIGERLARAYPARNGLVNFPFRRIFLVAHRKESQ